MAGPLIVDGFRPAVAWVASLPQSYRLIPSETVVLYVLASDSFDGLTSAPGWDNLAAWSHMLRSSVVEIAQRLTKPTEHRPALLAIESVGGRRRVVFHLLNPEPSGDTGGLAAEANRPASPDGSVANRPASPEGSESNRPANRPANHPANRPANHPANRPANHPATPDAPLPLPLPSPSPAPSNIRSSAAPMTACDLPEDWAPNDKHRQQVELHGLDLDEVVERFRDSAAASQRRRDWDGTFGAFIRDSAAGIAETTFP